MAEMPPIQITIDQEHLKASIETTIADAMKEGAFSLRRAADELDGGEWWRERERYQAEEIAKAEAAAYQRGRDDENEARKAK